MNRKMPSIHKRDGLSRDYYFARVPTDVRDKAPGRVLTIDFPSGPFDPALTKPVRIGRTHLRVALETRHPETAKVRHQIVGVAAARLYDSIRRGPEVLSQRRLTAVSRLAYDRFVALAGDNPGGEKRWTDFLAWSHAIRTGCLEFSMRVWPDDLPEEASSAERLPTEPSKAWDIETGMEMRFGAMADWALEQAGHDKASGPRDVILREIDRSTKDGAERLLKNARGDYRRDEKEDRFPALSVTMSAASSLTLTAVFQQWEKRTRPSPNTVMTWRGCLKSLREHLGHDDAHRLTKADLIGWKDSLLDKGLKPKTINDSHLCAARSVLAHAVTNDLLTSNAATGVRAAVKVEAGEDAEPYTDAEVARILEIASQQIDPKKRWLPMLAASTGARIGELAQIWGEHVREENGIAYISLEPTKDGGRLKNASSERKVPLHPEVIAAGFVTFVRSKGDGPLICPHREVRVGC